MKVCFWFNLINYKVYSPLSRMNNKRLGNALTASTG